MGIFRKKKIEVVEDRSENLSGGLLTALLGTDGVTRELALQIPSVASAIEKIGTEIAKLPIKLYQKDASGEIQEVKNDRRCYLLNVDTGDTLSTSDFWKAIVSDYFVGRGGFAYIDKAKGDVRSIRYVDCSKISTVPNNDPIFKDYDILVNGVKYMPFEFFKVLRNTKNGSLSVPICVENSEILAVAYASLIFEKNLVKKGGNKRGFFKSKGRMTDGAIAELRENITNLYNTDASERFVILNDGMEFQETSATSTELQLNENKKTNADEIFTIFGFPKSVIYGGASETDKDMFVNCVVGLLNHIEASLDRDLLKEAEKGTYYFAFDMKELTRGNIKERFEAYGIALDKSFMQLDEVRKDLDLPPLDFDYIKLSLADVLYNPTTKQVFTPNTSTTNDIGGGTDET